jgi:hypothetical protein
VRVDSLDVLVAELQAMELWDRAGGKAASENETNRAGFKARQMRRLEIIHEIEAMTNKSKFARKQAGSLG